MPSLKAGDLLGCLEGKLQAVEVPKSAHRRYKILDEAGNEVAATQVSHSWTRGTVISSKMAMTIKRELRLAETKDFLDLVSCPLSRAGYLQKVLNPPD